MHANEDRCIRFRTEFFGKSLADERITPARPADGTDAMELPKSIVDAVYANVARASVTGLAADEALSHYKRANILEKGGKFGAGPNVFCELFAKKTGGSDDLIGFSKP